MVLPTAIEEGLHMYERVLFCWDCITIYTKVGYNSQSKKHTFDFLPVHLWFSKIHISTIGNTEESGEDSAF